MVFLGMNRSVAAVPGFGSIRQALGFTGPQPFGAFTVAHNYGLQPQNRSLRECTDSAGHGIPSHPAQDGLNNLQKYAAVDHSRGRCYDTLPFRDQAEYDDALSIQQFKARGQYFLGCQQPMADDPTVSGFPDSSAGDLNTQKVSCERT
jgi:hypothetical protein